MQINYIDIKAINRNFYINEISFYTSKADRKLKKCTIKENGEDIYHSYNSEQLSDSRVISNCIERFICYLLSQDYQGVVNVYINSQFEVKEFDAEEGEGFFYGLPDGKFQIVLKLKYLNKDQITFANEVIKSLVRKPKSLTE